MADDKATCKCGADIHRPDGKCEALPDKPTGTLTDEAHRWAESVASARLIDDKPARLANLHTAINEIEAIVRKNISDKTEVVSKAFIEAIRKDERERAAKIARKIGHPQYLASMIADAILRGEE